MNRQTAIAVGSSALAVAGVLWSAQALVFMLTGHQPPLTFELGQLLFPVGVIAVYLTLPAPTRAANAGLTLAVLGIVGSLWALLYSLVPGAQISTSEDFVFPYSMFVRVGSLGPFLGLVLIGLAIWRTGFNWGRWRGLPQLSGCCPCRSLRQPPLTLSCLFS